MHTPVSLFGRLFGAPNVVAMRRDGATDAQRVRDEIKRRLAGSVTDSVVCQAQARGVRSLVGGRSFQQAIDYAVAWARCCDHERGAES